MSVACLTSAILLVGAPVNTGGLSLALPAEQIARAEDPKPAATATAAEPLPGENEPQQAAAADQEVMDVTVTARQKTEGDPLEKMNTMSFELTQKVDRAVVAPISLTFAKIVPTPVRDGLGNFLFNLHEPRVFVNFLLQHKVGKAVETVARFVVNSTIGIGGLFDIAKRKPFKLPRRPNGFADTLGFYGVKPGAYLFLPIVGPTTIRDIVGSIADQSLLPLTVGRPFNRAAFTLPTSIARTLDHRAYFDEELRRLREGPKDLYSARRDLYLQMRQDEIDDLRGRPHTPIRSSMRPAEPVTPRTTTPAPTPKPTPAPAPEAGPSISPPAPPIPNP